MLPEEFYASINNAIATDTATTPAVEVQETPAVTSMASFGNFAVMDEEDSAEIEESLADAKSIDMGLSVLDEDDEDNDCVDSPAPNVNSMIQDLVTTMDSSDTDGITNTAMVMNSIASIQSLTVEEVPASMRKTTHSISEGFDKFLRNDMHDYSATATIADNWNKNFTPTVSTDDEALQMFLRMHFGVYLNAEAFQKYKDTLSVETLAHFGCSIRELNSTDVKIILECSTQKWFDIDNFMRFALESPDSDAIISLMSKGIFNAEEASQYEDNPDAMHAYLMLKDNDVYNKLEFDACVSRKVNLTEYCKQKISSDVDYLSLVGEREDVADILAALVTCRDSGHAVSQEMLTKYKDCNSLLQILLAYSKGIWVQEFVDAYLLTNVFLPEFALKFYTDGRLNEQLYIALNQQIYAVIVMQDAIDFGIKDFEQLRAIALDETSVILTLLKKVYFQDIPIKELEYKKILFALAYADKEFILGCLQAHENYFTFSQLMQFAVTDALGVPFNVSESIGDNLNICISKHFILISASSFMYVREDVLKIAQSLTTAETQLHVDILPNDNGLKIYDDTTLADNVKLNSIRLGISSFEALASYGLDTIPVKGHDVFRRNSDMLYSIFEELKISPSEYTKGIMTSDSKLNYILYDSVFGFISSYYKSLAFLLASEHSKAYLSLLKGVIDTPITSHVLYKFLANVFTVSLTKNKFQCTSRYLGDIQNDQIIEIRGIAGLGITTYQHLLSNLDTVLEMSAAAKKVQLGISDGIPVINVIK